MLTWQLRPGTKAAHALECCAAAAAYLQSRGEPWTPYGLIRAYAARNGLNHETVWCNLRNVLRTAGLPTPAETIRFLAVLAERADAASMRFQWGRENEDGIPS